MICLFSYLEKVVFNRIVLWYVLVIILFALKSLTILLYLGRVQKEEALKFRVTKANEVTEIEKVFFFLTSKTTFV